MLTTTELARRAGVSTKTLQRWVERGLLPKPLIRTHPNGRGKVGYWPDDILAYCRRLQQLRRQGHALNEAALLAEGWTIAPMQPPRQLTGADLLGQKPINVGGDRRYTFLQLYQLHVAADLKQSVLHVDYQAAVVHAVEASQLLRLSLQLIEGGYSPLLLCDGKTVLVRPDFLVGCAVTAACFVLPLRPPFERLCRALHTEALIRPPSFVPPAKVWRRSGDALMEYAIYMGGGPFGFELIQESAVVIGAVPPVPPSAPAAPGHDA